MRLPLLSSALLALTTLVLPGEGWASPHPGPEYVDEVKVVATPDAFDVYWREGKKVVARVSATTSGSLAVSNQEHCDTGLGDASEVGYDVFANGFGGYRIVYSGSKGSQVRSSGDRALSGCRGNERPQTSLAPGVRLPRPQDSYSTESFFEATNVSVDAYLVPVRASSDDPRRTATVRFLRGSRAEIRPSFVAAESSTLFMVPTQSALQAARFDSRLLKPIDSTPIALVDGEVDHAIATDERDAFRVVYSKDGVFMDGLLSFTENRFTAVPVPGVDEPVRLLEGCDDPGTTSEHISNYVTERINADGSGGAVELRRTAPRADRIEPVSLTSPVRVFDRKTGSLGVSCNYRVCVVAMANNEYIDIRRVVGDKVEVLSSARVSTLASPANPYVGGSLGVRSEGTADGSSGCSTASSKPSKPLFGMFALLAAGFAVARKRRARA